MARIALILFLAGEPVPGSYESHAYKVIITECPHGWATTWYANGQPGWIGFITRENGQWVERWTGVASTDLNRVVWEFWPTGATYAGNWLDKMKQ
jgi:hypothetical protein